VSGRILHIIQALDNAFCVDKVEDSELKFFGSYCVHSSVSGEAVIEVGRAEDVDAAPRKSRVILASQSLTVL